MEKLKSMKDAYEEVISTKIAIDSADSGAVPTPTDYELLQDKEHALYDACHAVAVELLGGVNGEWEFSEDVMFEKEDEYLGLALGDNGLVVILNASGTEVSDDKLNVYDYYNLVMYLADDLAE